MKDYHSILGVNEKASLQEITSAYKKRLKVVHPDRFDPKKQPEEWLQANRMLQELNEAYNYLKNIHKESDFSDGRAEASSSSSARSTNKNASPPNQRETDNAYPNNPSNEIPCPARGISVCSIGRLKLTHLHFIKSLFLKSDEAVVIKSYTLFLNYLGLIITGYFYISNIQDWSKLTIVITENYYEGVALLLILGLLICRFGLVICRCLISKLSPCSIFTPMYYIHIKYDRIIFAYSWKIESFNFNGGRFLKFFQIKIGRHLDKFYLPIKFSFDKFKRDIQNINILRNSVSDPMAWLTTNDILRDLISEPIKRFRLLPLTAYLISICATIIVSINLGNPFIIIDQNTASTAKLNRYAAKESVQPALEVPTKRDGPTNYPILPIDNQPSKLPPALPVALKYSDSSS